ncbi:hypothetical protein MNBD_GAMMA21-653 [hydrothermal vent metagenome]|uniref:Methyltransferase domain-containing protein n=1 Tax=hydrothermal vent metagenome TaxID=652676 RepID=A0A3B1ALL4_9ZZZZ
MTRNRTVFDGVQIYSRLLLFFYDTLIMRLLTPYVWRCKATNYLKLYHAYMTPNHADIGVGTGYCLDRCQYQPGQVRIALIDLQQNCLDYSARRLKRFSPEQYQRNALEPVHINAETFDSIALGGILHCIPGDMQDKGKVFDSFAPIMNETTCVFGYTILNKGVRKTHLSRVIFYVLQKLKVINGIHDSAEQLKIELHNRFHHSEVDVIGSVAIFVAKQPRSFSI